MTLSLKKKEQNYEKQLDPDHMKHWHVSHVIKLGYFVFYCSELLAIESMNP